MDQDQQDQAAEVSMLTSFAKRIAEHAHLGKRLQACQTPEEILELAVELQTPFSRETLRSYSSELVADHWPWALKGRAYRLRFFGE